jgi:hypothetical protein
MFNFRARTTSNDSASSEQSQAPLTPLPRKLSLRSHHSATPTTIEDASIEENAVETERSLFRRASGNFEGLAELGGTTFAELLGRGDMRQSIILHADEVEVGPSEGGEGDRRLQEEEIILSLPGGGWGVVGTPYYFPSRATIKLISYSTCRTRRPSSTARTSSLKDFSSSKAETSNQLLCGCCVAVGLRVQSLATN